MRQLPFSFNSRQATKKVGSTHFQRRPRLPGIDRLPLDEIVSKRSNVGGFGRRPLLGEVVPDVRELVHQLISQKDHRNDDRDRDDSDDECVFDQALT
jgi:hypothetical protein